MTLEVIPGCYINMAHLQTLGPFVTLFSFCLFLPWTFWRLFYQHTLELSFDLLFVCFKWHLWEEMTANSRLCRQHLSASSHLILVSPSFFSSLLSLLPESQTQTFSCPLDITIWSDHKLPASKLVSTCHQRFPSLQTSIFLLLRGIFYFPGHAQVLRSTFDFYFSSIPCIHPTCRLCGFLLASLSIFHHPMSVCILSCFTPVHLFVIPWTVARQAPLSIRFSRQE